MCDSLFDPLVHGWMPGDASGVGVVVEPCFSLADVPAETAAISAAVGEEEEPPAALAAAATAAMRSNLSARVSAAAALR